MITLKITNTKNTSIIDGSDGLSLGEALKIAKNDRKNDYIIEVPGGSTYEATVTQELSFDNNNITLRGVGNGFSTIKINKSFPSSPGSVSFSQYSLDAGSSISLNNRINVFFGGIENLRDFDGNDLGSAESWEYRGMVDIQGDGDLEAVLTNSAIGRWATIGINTQFSVDNPNLGIDYSNYGEGGDTRIVGIYTDPLIATGEVEAGSPFDSQQRFQNDLFNDNLRLLAADDYDNDGLQETYFCLGDGTAVLHAYMHADGNIQYANYQSESDLEQFMTENGVANSIWEDWL